MPDIVLRELGQWWEPIWHPVSAVLVLSLHLLAAGHVVLEKRDGRAAIAWLGLIWLVPILGPGLYLLLGINRISRRAASLRQERGGSVPRQATGGAASLPTDRSPAPSPSDTLPGLAALVNGLVSTRLCTGNRIEPLSSGDAAYGAMLEAIAGATRSICLSTYIFDVDEAGERFVSALSAAVERGLLVRVLIDDAGARYSFPAARRILRKHGVRVAHFMPAFNPLRAPYINLRNHRKLLIVDGELGFTGGMNIRAGHLRSAGARSAILDLHFRIQGPLVAQLQQVFVEDWNFTTREVLHLPPAPIVSLPSPTRERGPSLARGLPDGPDGDFEVLRWTLLGAIASARHSILIMTPYFLPDATLMTALEVAALRGVTVDVLMPRNVNLPPVRWAMWGQLSMVADHGCRFWLSEGAFDHSKLVVIDRGWSLFGSANWDERSLRLNFEFCVEAYDPELAEALGDHIEERKRSATRVTPQSFADRALHLRLRDGLARLFAPYL